MRLLAKTPLGPVTCLFAADYEFKIMPGQISPGHLQSRPAGGGGLFQLVRTAPFAYPQTGPDMTSTEIKILIVDDDEDLCLALTDFISQMGVQVQTAGSVAEAQQKLQGEPLPFDLVLTDLRIPGGSGMDVLKAARERSSDSLVTIITGYASMDTAIEAARLGAYNYITKPFSLDEIGVQVRNMIERISLSRENARLSLRLQELYQQLERVERERADFVKMNKNLLKLLQENRRKLDEILTLHASQVVSE
jgi:DNA-binding response OmpR family regulator